MTALKPCGTPAAYARHVKRGEPVDDACRAAGARYSREARPAAVRVQLPSLPGAACANPRGLALFSNPCRAAVDAACEICAGCPARQACMLWGVMYEDEGIWGGLTRDELRRERYKHHIRRREPYTGWAVARPAPVRGELAS